MAHQHLGLAEIQGLAGLGDLSNTLVVFENYPVNRAALRPLPAAAPFQRRGPRCRPLFSDRHAAVAPGAPASCGSSIDPTLFDRASVEALGDRLVRLSAKRRLRSLSGRLVGWTFCLAAERQTILRDVERHGAGA